MRIVLTGASGRIGLALEKRLRLSGHQVISVVRPSSKVNLGAKKIVIDESGNYLKEIFEFVPEILIHAACCYGNKNEKNREIKFTNYTFGVDLIEALSPCKNTVSFINLDTALSGNINLYARYKKNFVEYCFKNKSRLKNIQFINLVVHNVYGYDKSSNNIIDNIIDKCLKNEIIELTSGFQEKDFIYIDDFISAVEVVIMNKDKISSYECIDIGSGVPYSIRKLADTIKKITNSKSQFLFGAIKSRVGEVNHIAEISKLQNFGFKIKTELTKGIEIIIAKKYS